MGACLRLLSVRVGFATPSSRGLRKESLRRLLRAESVMGQNPIKRPIPQFSL